MKKNLDIYSYSYPQGFRAKQINCIDVALACVAGYHNYDNYYYYVFYYALLNNWYDQENLPTSPKQILSKIGLCPKLENIYLENELIETIKQNIDNNIPVLLPTTYYSLFYSRWTYLDESNKGVPHLVIIDGYDDDKNVFIIRDTLHVAQAEMPKIEHHDTYQSIGFFKLQLTESMIKDIWKLSNEDLQTNMKNKLITIHKNENNYSSLNYMIMITDFVANYITKNNKLINYIKGFELNTTVSSQETIRNHFYTCMIPLFTILYNTLIQMKSNPSVINDFEKIKKKYLKHRDNVTAVIIKYMIKNKPLDDYKKELFIKEILKHDKLLIKFLKDIF